MSFENNPIRPIAVARLCRNGDYLVERGYDKVKDEYFYRAIGGGINFGEKAEDALIREYKEELGIDITVGKLFDVEQNIFTFNGKEGHEIVFIYDVEFADSSLYEQDVFPFLEESKSEQYAQWVSADVKIYPEIIKTHQKNIGDENE